MDYKLVNSTKDHNFYRTEKSSSCMMYNIAKVEKPMPTTGYWSASHVLSLHGYSNQDPHILFDMVGDSLVDPLNPEL